MATTRPIDKGQFKDSSDMPIVLTKNLGIVCLLRTLGVDRVNFRELLEKRRQRCEAIHHGLVVALDQESHGTNRRDYTLQAPALDGGEIHAGRAR